ncbi:hypothetical protein EG329_014162, partial [Mollisiaceae sp. DMI_Dod_QoI]
SWQNNPSQSLELWQPPFVRCRLIKTDLPSAVSSSYDALSYRWGSSLPKRDIVLDGRQVLVRFNLRDALKKLEYAQTERLLWVDAICINQDDISERNHQVAMMGIPKPLRYDVLDTCLDCSRNRPGKENHNPLLANMPQHRPGLYQGSLDQLDFSSTIAAKIDVLRVRRNTDPNGCELIALLEACEHSSSHDPRDRLYGILGLASDVSEQDFVIDYAITLRKLHEDLIRFYRRRFPKDEIKLLRFSQFVQRILGGQCYFDSEQQDLSSTTVNVIAYSRGTIVKTGSVFVDLTPNEHGVPISTLASPSDPWILKINAQCPPFQEYKISPYELLSKTLVCFRILAADVGMKTWPQLLKRTAPIDQTGADSSLEEGRRSAFVCTGGRRLGSYADLGIDKWDDLEDNDENRTLKKVLSKCRGLNSMGIAASDVQVGDEVYQFVGCDSAIIVREENSIRRLISAAIVSPPMKKSYRERLEGEDIPLTESLWPHSEFRSVLGRFVIRTSPLQERFARHSQCVFSFRTGTDLLDHPSATKLQLDIKTLQLISRW